MIAFEFDRAKIRHCVTKQFLIFVGSVTLLALFCEYIVPSLPAGRWASTGVQGSALTAELLVVYAVCAIGFSRKLRKRGPALIVDRSGIVDNASNYAFGQLLWAEIEKMYPQTTTYRLFGSRWRKMPIISQHRRIVIVLKEGVDMQARLQQKSWSIRYTFKEQFKQGHKPWLFIPEMLLDTPADEVMERLNKFYVTRVRMY